MIEKIRRRKTRVGTSENCSWDDLTFLLISVSHRIKSDFNSLDHGDKHSNHTLSDAPLVSVPKKKLKGNYNQSVSRFAQSNVNEAVFVTSFPICFHCVFPFKHPFVLGICDTRNESYRYSETCILHTWVHVFIYMYIQNNEIAIVRDFWVSKYKRIKYRIYISIRKYVYFEGLVKKKNYIFD